MRLQPSRFFGLFVSIYASAAICFLMQPRVYRSVAKVEVMQSDSAPVDPYFLQKQFNAFKSDRILQPVVQALDLQSYFGGGRARLTPTEALEKLRRNCSIGQNRCTALIDVEAIDRDPLQAARIAHQIFESFRVQAGKDIQATELDAPKASAQPVELPIAHLFTTVAGMALLISTGIWFLFVRRAFLLVRDSPR